MKQGHSQILQHIYFNIRYVWCGNLYAHLPKHTYEIVYGHVDYTPDWERLKCQWLAEYINCETFLQWLLHQCTRHVSESQNQSCGKAKRKIVYTSWEHLYDISNEIISLPGFRNQITILSYPCKRHREFWSTDNILFFFLTEFSCN